MVAQDKNEGELRRAMTALGLPPGMASFCGPEAARHIIEQAKQSFVTGGNPVWWWDSLKVLSEGFHYPEGDGFRHVTEYVPPGEERCWLVVEGDNGGPEHVLDVAVQVVPQIIGECFAFEYYLIGQDFGWLVAENHHNVVIVARGSSAQSDRQL